MRTRTADLYRANPRLSTANNLEIVRNRLSSWKRGEAGILTGEITGEEEFSGREQLEDCSGHEQDKTPKARNYSDNMKRPPAIAQLLPIAR